MSVRLIELLAQVNRKSKDEVNHYVRKKEMTTELLVLVKDLITKTPKTDEFIKKLFSFNEDVFGVYNSLSIEVKLFWSVIVLTAQRLGISLEGLTVVVLAHEYAHAYSHIGIDTNSHKWDSGAFANASPYIRFYRFTRRWCFTAQGRYLENFM